MLLLEALSVVVVPCTGRLNRWSPRLRTQPKPCRCAGLVQAPRVLCVACLSAFPFTCHLLRCSVTNVLAYAWTRGAERWTKCDLKLQYTNDHLPSKEQKKNWIQTSRLDPLLSFFSVLAKDLNLVPSIYAGYLTTACNSAPWTGSL